MLNIADLIPTQDGYRLPRETRENMLSFVANGGRYDEASIKAHRCTRNFMIAVTRFEDGALYLRDGLHRVTSIYISRPEKVLYDDEFIFEDMTYDMWINAEPSKGWYTPFDPRTDVRLPDFLDFKREVQAMEDSASAEEIADFINQNRHRYLVTRNASHTIEALSLVWAAESEVLI